MAGLSTQSISDLEDPPVNQRDQKHYSYRCVSTTTIMCSMPVCLRGRDKLKLLSQQPAAESYVSRENWRQCSQYRTQKHRSPRRVKLKCRQYNLTLPKPTLFFSLQSPRSKNVVYVFCSYKGGLLHPEFQFPPPQNCQFIAASVCTNSPLIFGCHKCHIKTDLCVFSVICTKNEHVKAMFAHNLFGAANNSQACRSDPVENIKKIKLGRPARVRQKVELASLLLLLSGGRN